MCLKELKCETCKKWFTTNHKRRFCHNPCGKQPDRKDPKGVCRMCLKVISTKGVGSGGYAYCSDECRAKKAKQRLLSDEEKDRRKLAREKRRARVCCHCRREYIPPHGADLRSRRYCGLECARAAVPKRQRKPRFPTMCRNCGSVVLRTAYEAHGKECFCDGECYLSYRKGYSAMVRIEVSDSCGSENRCRFCNGHLVGTNGERRTHCSKKCVQADAKQRRKMLKVCNGPVEPISIDVLAEKYDWTCCGCGCKCVKSSGNNRRDDATIDHIVPVTKGGTHTWSNVQLLCRMCNTLKSDDLAEGTQLQLALV